MANDWLDLLPTIVRTPIAVYTRRADINRWWKQLLVWAGSGATNVVVTGAAGSGKTTFALSLHGQIREYEWSDPKVSNSVERHAISLGDWTRIFSVIPGQGIRDRELGLTEAFQKHGSLEGVIHLVDFGFTTIRTDVAMCKLIESGVNSTQKVREFNMENELQEFRRICDSIVNSVTNGRGPKWLIIAVNKADLFLENLEQAKMYYHPEGDGKFAVEVNKLLMRVGTDQLICKVIPLCSNLKPFEWNGYITNPMLKTFDEPQNYLRNLVAILSEVSNGK